MYKTIISTIIIFQVSGCVSTQIIDTNKNIEFPEHSVVLTTSNQRVEIKDLKLSGEVATAKDYFNEQNLEISRDEIYSIYTIDIYESAKTGAIYGSIAGLIGSLLFIPGSDTMPSWPFGALIGGGVGFLVGPIFSHKKEYIIKHNSYSSRKSKLTTNQTHKVIFGGLEIGAGIKVIDTETFDQLSKRNTGLFKGVEIGYVVSKDLLITLQFSNINLYKANDKSITRYFDDRLLVNSSYFPFSNNIFINAGIGWSRATMIEEADYPNEGTKLADIQKDYLSYNLGLGYEYWLQKGVSVKFEVNGSYLIDNTLDSVKYSLQYVYNY